MSVYISGDAIIIDELPAGEVIMDFDSQLDTVTKHFNTANRAYEAMANFCRRVENWEIRSKTTYNQFKEILAEAGYDWSGK